LEAWQRLQAMGMKPEQLTRDALSDGAITHITSSDLENHQLQILTNQLKQIIRKKDNSINAPLEKRVRWDLNP
jgi:hypothetical protein